MRLECWIGESTYQGGWKPIETRATLEGSSWVFELDWKSLPEMRKGTWKVRMILPRTDSTVLIERLAVPVILRMETGITWTVLADDDPGECSPEAEPYTYFRQLTRVKSGPSVGCEGLQTPNAGAEDIIYHEEEIIPRDNGSDANNPAQPCTLHAWRDENYEEF